MAETILPVRPYAVDQGLCSRPTSGRATGAILAALGRTDVMLLVACRVRTVDSNMFT